MPLLGVAGVAIAVALIPRFSDLARPYGLLLIAKLTLFISLLVLASYNRWKHVPAMIAGSPTAAAALRRSIGWEIALIGVVFAATSLMTTYFSPEADAPRGFEKEKAALGSAAALIESQRFATRPRNTTTLPSSSVNALMADDGSISGAIVLGLFGIEGGEGSGR